MKVRVRYRNGRGYEMVWEDASGTRRSRACKSKDPRDAEREAAVFEGQLNDGDECNIVTIFAIYQEARKDFLEEQSKSYRHVMHASVVAFQDAFGWGKDVSKLNAAHVATLRKNLASRLSESTVNTYLRHIRTLLKWGQNARLIHSVPEIKITDPKISKSIRCDALSRTKMITIRDACIRVRHNDFNRWYILIEAMLLSGLRLGEALILSWDKGPFRIDNNGTYPMFRILAEGQKGKRDELCPIAPGAWEFFERIAVPYRSGRVLEIFFSRNYVSNVVSEILTDACGERVTAHDLRRAFGTRWAMKLKPAALMKLMRHTNIDTTMKFYVNVNANDVAEQLWSSE